MASEEMIPPEEWGRERLVTADDDERDSTSGQDEGSLQLDSPDAAAVTMARSSDSGAPDMKAAALCYLRAGVAPIPTCHPDPRGGFLREDDDGFDPNEPKYRLCVEHRGHRTEKGMSGKAVGRTPLEPFAKYQHQLPSEETVAAWWDRWPAANIAILTGNQYVVFDVDNPEALREARARGGLENAPSNGRAMASISRSPRPTRSCGTSRAASGRASTAAPTAAS